MCKVLSASFNSLAGAIKTSVFILFGLLWQLPVRLEQKLILKHRYQKTFKLSPPTLFPVPCHNINKKDKKKLKIAIDY
jgi:hypothetical protein